MTASTGPADPEVPPGIAALLDRIAAGSATHRAVTYHPEDPHAEVIAAAATARGLPAVPDPGVQFRTVRACPPPAAAPEPAREREDTEAVEAVAHALHTLSCQPVIGSPMPLDEQDATRHWFHARCLLAALRDEGWQLRPASRVSDPPPGGPSPQTVIEEYHAAVRRAVGL